MRGWLSAIKVNKNQFLSLFRNTVSFIGGVAVGKGWITADAFTAIAGATATIANALWAMLSHTKLAQIMDVERMDDVKQIVVAKGAADNISAAAASADHEKIVQENRKDQ